MTRDFQNRNTAGAPIHKRLFLRLVAAFAGCPGFPGGNPGPQGDDNSMLSPNLDALRRRVEASVITVWPSLMAGVRASIAGLVCSLCAMALAPLAIAQSTTYIYTGAPFTDCSPPFRGIPGGCSPGATRITGSFTVAKPLPNNLFTFSPGCSGGVPGCTHELVQIFPLSFNFTDGATTFTEKNARS